MSSTKADITEDQLRDQWPGVLELLLLDHSRGDDDKRGETHNIRWATGGYVVVDEDGYYPEQEVQIPLITGQHGDVVLPRVYKRLETQFDRTKAKAEVFTPGWVVNAQNNLVDEAWFGRPDVFNTVSSDQKTITPTPGLVEFPEPGESDDRPGKKAPSKTWEDYIRMNWLESACGEAPYLVSRYDAATGEGISLENRFGALDRKLRIIRENVDESVDEDIWFEFVLSAFKSVFGYEWQGDSLLVARENLLFTFFDVYRDRYGRDPKLEQVLSIAEVISWNLWQMDGLKYVVPETCHEEGENWIFGGDSLFGEEIVTRECQGCVKGDPRRHTGRYAWIMDWEKNKPVRFVDMLKDGGKKAGRR